MTSDTSWRFRVSSLGRPFGIRYLLQVVDENMMPFNRLQTRYISCKTQGAQVFSRQASDRGFLIVTLFIYKIEPCGYLLPNTSEDISVFPEDDNSAVIEIEFLAIWLQKRGTLILNLI